MFIPRCLLSCALLLLLGLLAGCVFSPDGPPPPRVTRGGFSVLVDGADHPAAARVIADIGSYAQSRGFVRQPGLAGPPVDPVTHESIPTTPERFGHDEIALEVSYQPATHRVTAYLHSTGPKRDRKFIDGFYHGFDREYAARYGGSDPISESGYSDDSTGSAVSDRPPGASVPGPGGGLSSSGVSHL